MSEALAYNISSGDPIQYTCKLELLFETAFGLTMLYAQECKPCPSVSCPRKWTRTRVCDQRIVRMHAVHANMLCMFACCDGSYSTGRPPGRRHSRWLRAVSPPNLCVCAPFLYLHRATIWPSFPVVSRVRQGVLTFQYHVFVKSACFNRA